MQTEHERVVTMRELYILAKALAYAIRAIEHLPARLQEFSDKEDMKRILHDDFAMFEEVVTQCADSHLRRHHIKGNH